MVHSFVRSPWANIAKYSPMILAKCCHDLDLIHFPIVQMILKGKNKIIKFIGNLGRNHAKLITLLSKINPPFKKLRYWQEWPVYYLYSNQKEDYSDNAKLEIFKSSQYWRCVYFCDNDIVDHQVVNI